VSRMPSIAILTPTRYFTGIIWWGMIARTLCAISKDCGLVMKGEK
jgi:hypothetical protein